MHQWNDSPSLYSYTIEFMLKELVDANAVKEGRGHIYYSSHASIEDPEDVLDKAFGEGWYGRAMQESSDRKWVVAQIGDALIKTKRYVGVTLNQASALVEVIVFSSVSLADAKEIGNKVLEHAPKPPPPTKGLVPMWFWTLGNSGPVQRRRVLAAPSWDKMEMNYTTDVKDSLAGLSTWSTGPEAGNRLLLLHGPPGTGKTHAIRAIAQQWKSWCAVHYIVDPEKFFENAAYMTGVLLDTGDNDTDLIFDEDNVRPKAELWRLLVIEDADELIAKDAKKRTGQSMSRLLNMSDGLIGQGLNILILITTNEPMAALHEAIIRPGRCIANLEVGPLSKAEANAWLKAKGSEATVVADTTIAELYEVIGTNQVKADMAKEAHGVYL